MKVALDLVSQQPCNVKLQNEKNTIKLCLPQGGFIVIADGTRNPDSDLNVFIEQLRFHFKYYSATKLNNRYPGYTFITEQKSGIYLDNPHSGRYLSTGCELYMALKYIGNCLTRCASNVTVSVPTVHVQSLNKNKRKKIGRMDNDAEVYLC